MVTALTLALLVLNFETLHRLMQQVHLRREASAYVADQQVKLHAQSLDARQLAIQLFGDQAMHFMAGWFEPQLTLHSFVMQRA